MTTPVPKHLPVKPGPQGGHCNTQIALHYVKYYITLYINIYIIAGKKSASWQLVAVVFGLKTMRRGKNRRKIDKINTKPKEKFALSQG